MLSSGENLYNNERGYNSMLIGFPAAFLQEDVIKAVRASKMIVNQSRDVGNTTVGNNPR